MMPKGVEHRRYLLMIVKISSVRIPMMPKGVEHRTSIFAAPTCFRENSDDAERR